MKHGRRKAEKSGRKVKKDRSSNGGGWAQTLGGLAILVVIPVLTILCLSPDVHDWVRASITAHFQPEDSSGEVKGSDASERMKRYRLPDSISKIAKISEAEPDPAKADPIQPSDFSRAIFRLQRALQAYPHWSTKEVFRAANDREASEKTAPCPFERIDGEQSVVLGEGKHGGLSLTETLNRCAAAVEQTAIGVRPAY
jgi:hypothetical protein